MEIPTFRSCNPFVLSDITLGCQQQEAISHFTLNLKSHFGVPHPSLLKDDSQKNVKRIWFRFLLSAVTCRWVSSSWLPATHENSSMCKLPLQSQGREGRWHRGLLLSSSHLWLMYSEAVFMVWLRKDGGSCLWGSGNAVGTFDSDKAIWGQALSILYSMQECGGSPRHLGSGMQHSFLLGEG